LVLALVMGAITVLLWNVFPHEPRVTFVGKHPWGWLSPDGGRLALPDSPWLWDTHSGNGLFALPEGVHFATGWPRFSADNKLMVWESEPMKLFFGDFQTGRTWAVVLPAPWLGANRFLFSLDSEILAVQDRGGDIVLIETASGRLLDRLSGEEDNQDPFWGFTAGGAYLAYPASDKKTSSVGFWNTRTRRREVVLDPDNMFVSISPDGKSLLTAQASYLETDDRYFHIFNLWDFDPPRKTPRAKLAAKTGWHRFSGNAFSADSKWLATWDGGGEQPGIVEFWNVQNGQRIAESPDLGTVYGGAWTPDGSHFAISTMFMTGGVWTGKRWKNQEERVKLALFDLNRKGIAWEQIWYRDSMSTHPTFSPSGNALAVYAENRIRFLDPTTGRVRADARAPEAAAGATTNHDVTPDKRRLVYREIGNTRSKPNWIDEALAWVRLRPLPAEHRDWDLVTVFDMETAQELVHLEYTRHTEAPLLSDDGSTLVTFHQDHVAIWDVPGRPPLRWVVGLPVGLWIASCLIVFKRLQP
jgi:hypothetical protein